MQRVQHTTPKLVEPLGCDSKRLGAFDALLRKILPPPFVAVGGEIEDFQDDLFPEESSEIVKAVEQRRSEFRAGRTCARKALARAGLPALAVPAGQRRQPVWPAGYTGSISHAGGFCVAAVCSTRHNAGVGVDIEKAGPLSPLLLNLVCRKNETRRGNRPPGMKAGRLGKLLFSAKESVYKCLFPVFEKEFEFADVEIQFDWLNGAFAARVSPAPLKFAAPLVVQGRFVESWRLVMTAAFLAADAGIQSGTRSHVTPFDTASAIAS